MVRVCAGLRGLGPRDIWRSESSSSLRDRSSRLRAQSAVRIFFPHAFASWLLVVQGPPLITGRRRPHWEAEGGGKTSFPRLVAFGQVLKNFVHPVHQLDPPEGKA